MLGAIGAAGANTGTVGRPTTGAGVNPTEDCGIATPPAGA
jgi:hypothetical protein